MWGRQKEFNPDNDIVRNTPTHVGKTPDGTPTDVVCGKHPHTCGEDETMENVE